MTDEKKAEIEKTEKIPKGPVIGMRHVQTMFLFFNIVVTMIGRINASVSIVAMTNAETTNPDFPEYDWSEKQKSYILSSFYWGYVLTQFPGGYLCRRFGAKVVLFISTLGSGLFSLCLPFCLPWGGWEIYCAIRVLQGLFQGVMFPCIHEHLAKWSPIHERNRLGALSHAGIECGTVLAMITTGYIAASDLGWPGISYVSGGVCLVWCFLWYLYGANNATSSHHVTQAERDYIESNLQRVDGFHKKKIPIPWRAILTSTPFWAVLLVRCAKNWGSSTLQFEIPSYMNGVLKLNIKKNALFSALPYLAMWLLSYVYLIIADVVMKRKWTTLTVLRKSINTVAMWVPAAGMIGVGFLDEDQTTLAICLMVLNVGVNSGATIGCVLNTIDLSPNHAGILMGIANFAANCVLIVTPLVAGVIVSDNGDRTQWQIVFLIAAIISFFGNLLYLIFGTAQTQPWNAEDYLMLKDTENSTSVSTVVEPTPLKPSHNLETKNEEKHENDSTPPKQDLIYTPADCL